jgi:hypothetical protein
MSISDLIDQLCTRQIGIDEFVVEIRRRRKNWVAVGFVLGLIVGLLIAGTL